MKADSSVSLRVEIALDLTCVHSYLGFTRFERVADGHLSAGGRLEVAFLPFQVSPDAPPEGRPLSEVHREFFGGSAEAERAAAEMAAIGARDGLQFNFDRAVHVNTFEAHRLLAAAARRGRGEPVAERLFRAYLTEGRNIGDRATLDVLAAEAGVERSAVGAGELRAELARVRALGIRSVPLFDFGGGLRLRGAQPEAAFRRAFADAREAGRINGR
ncbi:MULTISPECIES: DsbA family protein [unclassified Streptomyces]|uniref:DsbA family protein n=1 Tax=unclassified Streptomyces TaxID=2593676 RepID=UPI00278BC122|nr:MULTISPECIES: DsbA family protein [unclassified Streptomyces]